VTNIHLAASQAADLAGSQAQARLAAVEGAAQRVIDTLGRLDSEFAGSGDTVQRVRRELAELAAWIIERLDGR
jgi:archaellum component FlaC